MLIEILQIVQVYQIHLVKIVQSVSKRFQAILKDRHYLPVTMTLPTLGCTRLITSPNAYSLLKELVDIFLILDLEFT